MNSIRSFAATVFSLLVILSGSFASKSYSQANHVQQAPVVAEIEWSPEGTLLAVGTETGVQLFTSQLQKIAFIEVPFAQGLAWSPNGEKLAIGYYDTAISIDSRGVQIWDVTTLSLEITLPSERSDSMQLIWHPDGKHLIVSNGGRLERWDITSVERTNIYDNGFISGHMDMTSDGNLLVSETSNNSITVWDVDSTEILHQLYVEDTLIAVALDDVGSRVAANSGDTILIWSLATEKTLASLQSSGLVLDLVWNADILTTMSSLSDGTVEITAWDTNTYSSTQTVQSSLIFDVALDSTGTCLAYGQSLDTLQINEISERSCN